MEGAVTATGEFVCECRVTDDGRPMRWVLMRGAVERDAGAVQPWVVERR